MRTSLLEINKLDKRFITSESEVHVLKDINLTINEGEFISIIGPSGCGKSTLLRIIGGLDQNFTGDVLLSDHSISQPSIEKGLIFQEPRLFPWLTVEKNIAADLSLKNADIRQKTDDLIKLVKLTGFEKSYPRELSGGMAQRVSIARALLRDPRILLLDEPFGALDAFTRAHMQEALLEIWSKNKVTMVFVTHDIDEAIFLGTKIFILKPRPGELRSIVPVDLPYPRVKTSANFQELRSKVLNDLEGIDEVSWGESGAGI